MKRFLLYLLTAVSIVACSEGEPADNGSDDGGGNTPTTPTITLNKSSVSFDELADEESISFSATADWIAEIVNDRADGWLSVTPQSGSAGYASITIKAKENDTPDERNASVRIKAGSASKTISVSQKQKDALTVTASKFEIEAEGGEVKIEVKANIDFEYAIDESAKEWIKYEGTRAMKTSTLTFSVAENDDTDKREGKIAIKSGEFNEVVTIYQAGSEPSIVISQNECVVSSDGETISVEVSSNVDVEIEMPADADWISENTTRATSTNTYRFDIQPNEDYDQRTAEIKFTNKENNLSEVVKVTQVQKDALVVAKESYTVDSNGGQLQIEVGHNVDFDIEIANDWITKAENTRAFVTESIVFNIAKNPTTDNREGTIVFKSKDGKLSQTVKVFQAQEDALIISKKDIVVSDEGGTISFELQTNVEFKVSDPDVDWLRTVVTRGLTTHTLHYEYDANSSYDSREAHIVVTNTKTNASETITITQTQKDAIVLAKDSYTVSSEGDHIEIEVGHNVDFDIEISNNWITKAENTRAFVTETLNFNIAKNPTTDNREGTIIFKSKDSKLSQTVKVYQAQEDALIISKKDIVVSDEGGTISFELQTNVEFKVSDPDVDWLRPVTTRALTTHTLNYTVDANTSYDSREAKIVVTDTKNNKSETITITQAQKDAIVLAKSEYEFGVDGGNLDFEIQTNVDVTVTIAANATDWIQQVETRALETKALYFNVAACSAEEDREGTITISGGNATQTITVKQSGLKEILEKEREALIALYNATGGDNWTCNDNWCSDKPVSEWYGITVENGNVTNIDLHYNNLSGSIPLEIVKLTNLVSLNIAENKLVGSIPSDIGNLRNLTYLILCDNLLSGNIPESIYQIPTLTLLHLSRNKLSGEIPESLGDCLALENLYLDENELTGGIPANLSKIPNLKVLHLGNNKLFGEIPSALGDCPVLENLFLYDNELTGKLPEEIINIHTLKQLRIQNNKLNGECSELLTTFIENLDVYYIEQQPGYELKLNFYQSTDFSQDGKVITLQQHTKGPGIKFVITMDGFSDRLITDGTVNSYIQMAYETLFSREPYTSFKEYFDVYAVLTVSKREKLMTDTALQTGGEVDRFCLHHDLVEAYAKKIPAINNDMSNTHILVILNDKSGIRANCSWTSYGSMSCASIIMEDNTSRFDGVIRHEVLGHGFGRLADEYVEVGLNGDFSNYPEEDKQGIWDEHKRGWYLNVDVTNDPEKIVWKDFLSNPDYASENIGIYEGALLYERGAYRATDYSIMRYNTGDFNAPSRWAIYKHIMEIAGEEYSLETFFEYDKKNLVQTRSTVSKSAQSTPVDPSKLGAKPVFLNR